MQLAKHTAQHVHIQLLLAWQCPTPRANTPPPITLVCLPGDHQVLCPPLLSPALQGVSAIHTISPSYSHACAHPHPHLLTHTPSLTPLEEPLSASPGTSLGSICQPEHSPHHSRETQSTLLQRMLSRASQGPQKSPKNTTPSFYRWGPRGRLRKGETLSQGQRAKLAPRHKPRTGQSKAWGSDVDVFCWTLPCPLTSPHSLPTLHVPASVGCLRPSLPHLTILTVPLCDVTHLLTVFHHFL